MDFSRAILTFVNTNGDAFSDWVAAHGWSRLELGFKWDAFGGRSGILHLQGSPIVTATGIGAEQDKWIIDDVPVVSGFYGAWPNIGATADRALLVISNPMSFHRVWFETTGGGDAADHIQIQATLSRG